MRTVYLLIFILISLLAEVGCKSKISLPKNFLIPPSFLKKQDIVIDDMAASKNFLDSLFRTVESRDSFYFNVSYATLLMGRLFSAQETHAVMRFAINDSINEVVVLKRTNLKWDTALAVFTPQLNPAFGEITIQLKDFDGDGHPDLSVMKLFGEIRTLEVYDLWMYRSNGFQKIAGFDTLYNPETEKGSDRVYCYASGGCADMAMGFAVARIVDGKIKMLREIGCDCCSENGDSCIISKGSTGFKVPIEMAYKYVPKHYAAFVKEKCTRH